MGSDTRFLRRKGKGCHNRWIGDGSGGRSGPGGSYILPVLAYTTFCGGKDFGKVFLEKSGGYPWPCGGKTIGDGGCPGLHDGAEVQSMEVLENVGLGGKCVDVVKEQGVRRYG